MANEKRLIDANALIEEAYAEGAYGYIDAKQIVEAPTVDAVPVVRCWDCKWSKRDTLIYKYWCKHFLGEMEVRENDYCSYGERKESGKRKKAN